MYTIEAKQNLNGGEVHYDKILVFSALKNLLKKRLVAYFQKVIFELDAENYFTNHHPNHLAKFVRDNNLSFEEQTVLLLALVPHIKPDFFDETIKDVMPQGGEFPEFGGARGSNHRGMLPTGETVQFILAGNDLDKRIEIQRIFSKEHSFHKNGILWLETMREGEPVMSGRLIIAPEWVEYMLTGIMPGPSFSPDFPARLLTTKMEWRDLVLHSYTFDLLNDIRHWLEHHPKLYVDAKLSPKNKTGLPGIVLWSARYRKNTYRIPAW